MLETEVRTAQADAPPLALLVDFGGVLTSSVIDAIQDVSDTISGDPGLIGRLFNSDDTSSRLLVEHECGRISEAEFESGFRDRLMAHAAVPPTTGVIKAIQSRLYPDEAMLEGLALMRDRGVRVAIVSNALGDDGYAGWDLGALADAVVLSSEVGIRKPSRRIYSIACDRLGVEPGRAVMVDDLEHNLVGAARIGVRGILHQHPDETLAALSTIFRASSAK